MRMRHRICTEKNPAQAFQEPVTTLRELVRDMGLATRVVLAALFDDTVLGVPSVVQLTINLAAHFAARAPLSLSLDQQVEALLDWSVY